MTTRTKRSTLLLASLLILTTALAACAPSSGGSGKATDVKVTLTDFKVESSLTTFSVGVPYHFTIVNNGSVAHEVVIMPPADPANAQAALATAVVTALMAALAAVDYVTVFDDEKQIFEAICSGASGYLLKSAQPHEIIEAVRQVLAGGAPMDARIARKVRSAAAVGSS